MKSKLSWPLGVSSCFSDVFDDTFLQQLQIADIHYTELSGSRPDYFEALDFVHRAGAICKHAMDYQVTIHSVHLPFTPSTEIDLTLTQGALHDKTMSTYAEMLKAAGDAGIQIAVVHPSYGLKPEQNRMELLKGAGENLAVLSSIAKRSGMQLAVENLPRTCLGNTREELRYLLDTAPDLMACFDTNHSLYQSNHDFIEAIGDRIITLHISDYDGTDERHWLPLKGINDWNALLKQLESIDYNGVFMYEIPGHAAPTTADIRENYLRIMQR